MADLAVPPGAADLEPHTDGGYTCHASGCSEPAAVSVEVQCNACGDFAQDQLALAVDAGADIVALEVDARAAREAQTAATQPVDGPFDPADEPDDEPDVLAEKAEARAEARAEQLRDREVAWRAAGANLDRTLELIAEATKRRALALAAARDLDEPHTHPRYWCATHRPEA